MTQHNSPVHGLYDLSDVERFVPTPAVDFAVLRASQHCVSTIDFGGGAFIMDMHEFATRYPERAQQTFLCVEHRSKLEQCAQQVHAHGERSLPACHRGYVLYVPARVRLAGPVDLRCIGEYADFFLHEQVAIIVESGASVTVYDYCGTEATLENLALVVRSVSWWVGDGAQLTFIHDQQYAMQATAFTTFVSYGHAASIIDLYLLVLGASFSRITLDISVNSSNAQVTVRGVYALAGVQRAQIISRQTHQATASTSNVYIKGLLTDSARAVFKGTIFIDEHAASTNARLENKNLLLSGHARVNSMPILQVLHNDVQCAHGSATSQLDAESLFYLYARGIEPQVARKLLLGGFVADLLPAQYSQSMLTSVCSKVI